MLDYMDAHFLLGLHLHWNKIKVNDITIINAKILTQFELRKELGELNYHTGTGMSNKKGYIPCLSCIGMYWVIRQILFLHKLQQFFPFVLQCNEDIFISNILKTLVLRFGLLICCLSHTMTKLFVTYNDQLVVKNEFPVKK